MGRAQTSTRPQVSCLPRRRESRIHRLRAVLLHRRMSAEVEISVEALAEKLRLPENERPVLLDVRRPEEHMFVSLHGSTLIPLHELKEREKEVRALGQKPVV